MAKIRSLGSLLGCLYGLLLIGVFLFVCSLIPPLMRSTFVREIVGPAIIIVPLILLAYALLF